MACSYYYIYFVMRAACEWRLGLLYCNVNIEELDNGSLDGGVLVQCSGCAVEQMAEFWPI